MNSECFGNCAPKLSAAVAADNFTCVTRSPCEARCAKPDKSGARRRTFEQSLFSACFLQEADNVCTMNIVIEFNHSAFKHGVTEADIRYAIINAVIYDDIWDDAADKHLLLGFDDSGRLLEIMYNVIDEQSINVFHAMKCRSIYYHLLNT